MTIDDRDYMRERLRKVSPPRKPWWKRITPTPALFISIAVLALGTVSIGLLRDARSPLPLVKSPAESMEGSLRVNINTATLTELESIPGIGPSSIKSMRPFVKVEGETEKLR